MIGHKGCSNGYWTFGQSSCNPKIVENLFICDIYLAVSIIILK